MKFIGFWNGVKTIFRGMLEVNHNKDSWMNSLLSNILRNMSKNKK